MLADASFPTLQSHLAVFQSHLAVFQPHLAVRSIGSFPRWWVSALQYYTI
jgi:hypothetical protein